MPRRSTRRAALPVLALAAALLVGCGDGASDPVAPNVLVFVVDTLRADHLSAYGYARNTSPALEALARRGWTFENHISHAGHTVPSTISLMVSQTPAEHGYVHRVPGQFAARPPVFDRDLLFLSEVLRDAGWATLGVVANPFLGRRNGFSQGLEDFVQVQRGDFLTTRAIRWLERHRASSPQPFFAYLHYMDVHNPYEHPEPYADLYTGGLEGRLVYRNGPMPDLREQDLLFTKARYDAGIRFVDDQLAVLLEALDRLALRERTVVVFTSDHGDEFMEHGGLGHGTSAYGELVRVPLVISFPGVLDGGRRITHLTQVVDVAPTLLELAGVGVPPSFRGRSLMEPADKVFTEGGPWRGVYARGHKLLRNVRTQETELYAAGDPLDREPLTDPEREAELSELLDGYLETEVRLRRAAAPDFRWREEEIEELRALGYVE